MDSTGLKLCGAGEWLVEKHGASRRRSWRKLHIGVDAATGQVVAATLTTNDVDDGTQVGTLLDQVDGPIASFTADGAYDQDAWAAIRPSPGSSQVNEFPLVSTSSRTFRHVISGSLSLASPDLT